MSNPTTYKRFLRSAQEEMPSAVFWLNILAFAYLAFVIYAFTPYTNNLDEIKVSALFLCGPLFFCAYLIYAGLGYVRLFPVLPLIPLAGYAILMLPGTLIAGKPYTWIGWIEQMLNIAVLGGFFCFFGLMRTKRDVHRTFFIYTLLGLGTALFGLFHYSGGFSVLHKILYGEGQGQTPMSILFKTFMQSQDEMFGTILNRQFYAAFLVMLLPLSTAYAIIETKSHIGRYAAISAIIMMSACLYLTHSKASLGAIIAAAAAFYILYKLYAKFKEIRIPHLGIWIAGLATIAITLGLFTMDTGPEKFKTVHRSVASRAIIWKGAWDMFLYGPGPQNWYEVENPPINWRSVLIGCGPASFRILFPRYRSPDYHLHDISNVTLSSHNRFLDLLAENGLAGFLCYITFLFIFFGWGLKLLKKSKNGELRVCIMGIMCGAFGLYLTNLFSPNSRWAANGMNLWVLLGIGFGVYDVAREDCESEAAGKPRRGSFIPIPKPAVSTLMFALAVLLLPIIFFSARYGIRYFIAAKLHNNGLIMATVGEQYMDAMKELSDKAQAEMDSSEATQNRIKAFAKRGTEVYNLAIDYYKRSLSYNPTFITTYYKMAHSYNSLGDMENSLKTYQELQKYAPEYSEIHFNLGVVNDSLAQKKKNQALREMSIDSMDIENENSPKAVLLREAENHSRVSLQEFKIAARMSNKEAVQDMYGKKLIMAEEYEKARDVYRTLSQKNPHKIEYKQAMVYLAERLKDDEEALVYLKQLFESDPANEQYSNRIEAHFTNLNRPEDYEKFLLEHISINPLDPQPRMKLLELYTRRKDAEKIQTQLKIISRLPELTQRLARQTYTQQNLLWQLATTARDVKDLQAEKFFLNKCLQLDEASSAGKASAKRLMEISG
ncbi:MAG TPA: O-antigen ligase family protein [Candidatus Sumerlaeia bacterium]|nr:O-antigen ligase family protein [Candidatus Sumerlaeia bacterium]